MSKPVPKRTVCLRGIRAETLADLCRYCETAGIKWRAAADLSLGSWRSHQVACELSLQLGLGQPWGRQRAIRPPQPGHSIIRYAGVLAAGVDSEAQGDQRWLAAVDALQRISVALAKVQRHRACLVLCPRRDADWENEDVMFVEAATARQETTGVQLVLVSTDSCGPLPTNWSVAWESAAKPPSKASVSLSFPAHSSTAARIIGLVPGVMDRDFLTSLGFELASLQPAMLDLPGGQYLVPPEWRPPRDTVSRLDFDRIAAYGRDHPWLAAYAQYHGNNFFVNSTFLAEQAWERFQEGGGGIGIRLLERARTCARTGTDRAAFQAQLQGMRIALGRFEDAAAEADPPPGLYEPLDAFLRIAKGWGLAMQDPPGPEQALGYLHRPSPLTSLETGPDHAPSSAEDEEREHLFLLNIRALAQLKVGNLDGALDAEMEIHRRSQALAQRDWTLEYINAINLARLHRRTGHLKRAAKWYQTAFATSRGARTWPEAVHANVWEAIMAAEQGELANSLWAWIRAAMHWIAAETPEGIGTRVAAAILRRRAEPDEDLAESVSACLLESVRASWAQVGPEMGEEEVATVPLVASLSALARIGHIPPMDLAIGTPGWSVLLTDTPAPYSCPSSSHEALRRFLGRMVGFTASSLYTREPVTIVIDDELGLELPRTRGDLIASALRLNTTTVSFDGEILQVNPMLRHELTRAQRAHIGQAVCHIDHDSESTVVYFKRHLPPRLLDVKDAEIVRALEDCPTVGDLVDGQASAANVLRLQKTLRRLEQWRVIKLFTPEDTNAQWMVPSRLRARAQRAIDPSDDRRNKDHPYSLRRVNTGL